MDPRHKPPRNQVDPGRRLVQLALKQAVSSKLSLMSPFKREFDKKKRDKWKTKNENCQEQVLKTSLVPPELAAIMKIEKPEANINAIERKNTSLCNKIPKGRGRGKRPSNRTKPSDAFGKRLEVNHYNGELQDLSNRDHSEKMAEIMKEIEAFKANVITIERKMPCQIDKAPKGRGRGWGKPPSNQSRPSDAFGKNNARLCDLFNGDFCEKVKKETSIEPPIQLLHQFSSSSENDISASFVPLQSGSAAAAFNAKTPLHSSLSNSLDSSFVDKSFNWKSHATKLFASDDTFTNATHTKKIGWHEKESWFLHKKQVSSADDKRYFSCSSFLVSDNEFSIMPTKDSNFQEKESLFHHDKELSPIINQRHFSSSSLFVSDNKYPHITKDFGLTEQKDLLLHDKGLYLHSNQDYSSSPSLFFSDNKLPNMTQTKSFGLQEKEENLSISNEKKVTDLLTGPYFSVALNISHDDLLLTVSNQFQSAMIPKNTIFDNGGSKSDQKSLHATSVITSFHKCRELEPEDKYIAELIDSFIDKPENKKIDNLPGPFMEKPEDKYIDDLIDSFIDKPEDKKIDDLPGPFIEKPEDKYIDELIDSFIDKTEDKTIDDLIDPLIDKPEDRNIDESVDSFIDVPDDKLVNSSTDSFIENSDDKYIYDLIDSFIGKKSNVLSEIANAKTKHVEVSKECSFIDESCNLFSLLSVED